MAQCGTPQLRVSYANESEFYAEYAKNIANGGIFVATEQPLDVRTFVLVLVELPFCGRSFELEAEVVHVIPAELAKAGATAGVALQFRLSATEIRAAFEPLSSNAPVSEAATHSGRRSSPRAQARVHAAVEGSSGRLEGRTRNLSSSGVLLTVRGNPVPIGEVVQLTITHPQTGEKMKVKGEVRRHMEAEDGRVTAMGIAFQPDAHDPCALDAFVREVGRAEHNGRLGGISGSVADLGLQKLLELVGSSAPCGTVTLTRGVHEGFVAFENGILRIARLGPQSGIDALREMLTWREGEFDFQARIDPSEPKDEFLPLAGAIEEALDPDSGARARATSAAPDAATSAASEGAPLDRVSPGTVFEVNRELADKERPHLGKTEEAVLDLAMVGMSVSQMIGVIPEPEVDVLMAVDALRERAILA